MSSISVSRSLTLTPPVRSALIWIPIDKVIVRSGIASRSRGTNGVVGEIPSG